MEAPSRQGGRYLKVAPAPRTPVRQWLRRLVIAGGILSAVFALFVFAVAVETARGMQDPEQIIYGTGGVEIVDRNGAPLFQFSGEGGGFRQPVRLQDISPNVINATIATEDPNFWHNPGVNLRGLLRATYENLAFWKHGGFLKGSGGSSITQQLAKNLYIPADQRSNRSLTRKLKETIYAVELNRRYSKDQILEWYLNQAFYGHNAYGIEAAAQRYFNKSAKDLTMAEATLLAGLPNAPSLFDPITNLDAAHGRQKQVLDLMVRHGYLKEADAQAIEAAPVKPNPGQVSVAAPHFATYVRDLLPSLVGKGKARGPLRVVTTLDVNLQRQAEDIVQKYSETFRKSYAASNAALVAMDPKTGEVLAMVGSPDYFDETIDGQVNNATALNQPGSSIKPITYMAAFMKGWSPATPVDDSPLTVKNGSGSLTLGNADGRYRGRVPVRVALGSSLNVPAVRALQYVGLDTVYGLARQMGLSTLKDISNYGPSFTLGGVDVNLLDMTFAYTTFAGYGEQSGMPSVVAKGSRALDPISVLRIEDAEGKTVWQPKRQTQRIVPPGPTYLVTSILTDNNARVSMFGASNALQVPGRTVAVKTGLSDNARDAWAMGYTPSLVAGVWVGNADNTPMQGATSGTTAAPIFRDFMLAALKGKPNEDFPPPDDVRFARVCESTGTAPDRGCSNVVTDVFLASNTPAQASASTGGGPSARPTPGQPTQTPFRQFVQPTPQRVQPTPDQPYYRQGNSGRGNGNGNGKKN